MPVTINGNGTITGISVGGLPDGCITADDLASGAGGKILQFISTTKTDQFSSTSTSMVDVTGITATITPTSSSNKIFIATTLSVSHSSGAYPAFNLLRDSTHIAVPTGNALWTGSGRNTSFGPIGALDSYKIEMVAFTFLDEPADTNAHTYKLQVGLGTSSKTLHLNKPISGDTSYTYPANGVSTFTVMEVAG